MHRLVAAAKDEAFQRTGLGWLCDEEMAELRPVELDLVRGKGGLELADEVVGDANVVRVGAQVREGEVRRKVVRMEETEEETRHGEATGRGPTLLRWRPQISCPFRCAFRYAGFANRLSRKPDLEDALGCPKVRATCGHGPSTLLLLLLLLLLL